MGGKNEVRYSININYTRHTPSHVRFVANQFRALEEDEIMFLDSIREKQAEEERLRKTQDGEELSDFRK